MSDRSAPVDSPLLLACRELARAMDMFDEAACSALGLGRSDLRALNLLEHGPLGASALARELGLTRPAVTALIDRLAAAGYVARVAVPGDSIAWCSGGSRSGSRTRCGCPPGPSQSLT